MGANEVSYSDLRKMVHIPERTDVVPSKCLDAAIGSEDGVASRLTPYGAMRCFDMLWYDKTAKAKLMDLADSPAGTIADIDISCYSRIPSAVRYGWDQRERPVAYSCYSNGHPDWLEVDAGQESDPTFVASSGAKLTFERTDDGVDLIGVEPEHSIDANPEYGLMVNTAVFDDIEHMRSSLIDSVRYNRLLVAPEISDRIVNIDPSASVDHLFESHIRVGSSVADEKITPLSALASEAYYDDCGYANARMLQVANELQKDGIIEPRLACMHEYDSRSAIPYFDPSTDIVDDALKERIGDIPSMDIRLSDKGGIWAYASDEHGDYHLIGNEVMLERLAPVARVIADKYVDVLGDPSVDHRMDERPVLSAKAFDESMAAHTERAMRTGELCCKTFEEKGYHRLPDENGERTKRLQEVIFESTGRSCEIEPLGFFLKSDALGDSVSRPDKDDVSSSMVVPFVHNGHLSMISAEFDDSGYNTYDAHTIVYNPESQNGYYWGDYPFDDRDRVLRYGYWCMNDLNDYVNDITEQKMRQGKSPARKAAEARLASESADLDAKASIEAEEERAR